MGRKRERSCGISLAAAVTLAIADIADNWASYNPAATHGIHNRASMPVCILSVSYDRALLMTRQLMLEAQGYAVISALGFTEAERQCQEGRFDLLIMGHSIPVTDKRALIERFRETSGTPVVSILRAGEALVRVITSPSARPSSPRLQSLLHRYPPVCSTCP